MLVNDSIVRKSKIIIIGAGAAGTELAQDIVHTQKPWEVVGFLDDKKEGDDVLGVIDDLPQVLGAKGVQKVFFAIPRVKTDRLVVIRRICHEHGVDFFIIPPKPETVANEAKVSMLRKLHVSDLMGRAFQSGDLHVHKPYYANKTVLVTGAAGSIGSELVTQLLEIGARVICADVSEYGVFKLHQKHSGREGFLSAIVDLKDAAAVEELLVRHKGIDVVFHAAAYKHVPLMESHPKTCFKNNVVGTQNLFQACRKVGVPNVVLISTDKAVRPSNIMGATKRLCEMEMSNYTDAMKINCVRFGNVLGSSGSVVQIFQNRVETGLPLHVTDKRMRRYFMSIPEAVFLILETGKTEETGRIFLLEMGEMIPVVELAEKVIQVNGYLPHEEIPIHITQPRPGEKLEEDLYANNERSSQTVHDKIYAMKEELFALEKFNEALREFLSDFEGKTDAEVRDFIFSIVR